MIKVLTPILLALFLIEICKADVASNLEKIIYINSQSLLSTLRKNFKNYYDTYEIVKVTTGNGKWISTITLPEEVADNQGFEIKVNSAYPVTIIVGKKASFKVSMGNTISFVYRSNKSKWFVKAPYKPDEIGRLRKNQKKASNADKFPGAIPNKAKYITKNIKYDLNRTNPSYLKMRFPNKPRISTGLYVPAGENIIVTVSLGYNTKLINKNDPGLIVQIGAHTSNLDHKSKPRRDSNVAFSQRLLIGENLLSSPYGGLLYFEAVKAYRKGTLDIKVSGVIEAPYFIAGKHNNNDWYKIRKNPAPWGEVHTGNMIVTLPKHQILKIKNIEEYCQVWETIMANTFELQGLKDDSPIPHKNPSEPSRFVIDIDVAYGWMFANYPMFGPYNANLWNIKNIKNWWGVWHEIGHLYQQSAWMLPGTSEVTTNLFSLYQQEFFTKGKKNRIAGNTYKKTKDKMKGGGNFYSMDVWEKLVVYHQLVLAYGWDFYKKLHVETRQLAYETNGKVEKKSTEDYFLEVGSKIAQENLTSFFEYYGIKISRKAKNNVKRRRFPEPAKAIWKYKL